MHRSNRSLLTVLAFITLSCVDGWPTLCAQDSALQRRFLNEAPQAWEEYRLRARRLQGTVLASSVRLAPKREMVWEDRMEFKQRSGCALFITQAIQERGKPAHGAELRGLNPGYGFEMSRKTPTAPWVVSRVHLDLSDGTAFHSLTDPSESLKWLRDAPFTFATVPEPHHVIVKEPGFTCKGVIAMSREGRDWVKVDFDYRPQGKNPRIPVTVGWVVYDPKRYWVIREFDIQLDWPGAKFLATETREYEEASDGFPLLKKILLRYKKPSEGYDSEKKWEFDLREADVPESEFTLSAFGFAEPGGIPRQPTPWYFWAGLVGIVCISLAVLVRWLGRRAERRAA